MAGLRVSQLPPGTAIAAADLLIFSSIAASETRSITANNLAIALGLLGTSVGPTQPLAPSNGQLWVDTSTNPPCLKIWNGATFSIVSFVPGSSVITNPGSTAPASPVLGQLWQDTSQTPDELKMWDGSNWVRVDPQGITQTAADIRYLQIAAAAATYLPLSGGTLTGNLNLVGVPTSTNMAATKGYVDTQIAAIPTASDLTPAGTVIWTARNTAPTGYLKADGSAISRTTYSALFSAIGTTFGAGNGSTTFNLPDLRGEFVRSWDDGRGIDSGRAFGSAQADDFKSHNHTVTDLYNGDGGGQGAGGANTNTVSTTQTTSSSGGTETRPRNIALLACVKT